MYSVVDLIDAITCLCSNCMGQEKYADRVEQLTLLNSVIFQLGNYLQDWKVICENPGVDLVNKPLELSSSFCLNE